MLVAAGNLAIMTNFIGYVSTTTYRVNDPRTPAGTKTIEEMFREKCTFASQ